MRYENKTAVVTGGNSGIGLATARRLREEGARVAIFGRNEQANAEAAESIGGDTLTVPGDVTNLDDLDHLAERVNDELGKIDLLVVNAGIARFAPVEAVDEAHFDQHFDINVKGAYFTIQKTLPLIADGGAIVLIASIVNQAGFPGASVYSASKAAMRSLARTLSAELLPRGIRVNVVSPGPIETPIYDKMGMDAEETNAFKQDFAATVPQKRMGRPEEIASVVAFLGSDDAGFVLGGEINVDGGMIDLLPRAAA